MAILFKAVAGASSATTSTTASLGSASIGDLVVVCTGGPTSGSGAGTVPTDNAGNTYTKISSRNDGANGGAGMFYSFLTVANAALTVSYGPPVPAQGSIVAHLLSGALAYNADFANAADFSGTSTAWAVGPTTLTPPANSIVFYSLGADTTETATPNATGYNTTGSNGFTAGMNTSCHQETQSASAGVCVAGYRITSAAASAAITLPVASNWFGVIASFSPAPTQLLFGTQPTASTSGQAIPTFTVRVAETGGATVATATNTVTVTASLGVLSGTLSVAAVNGVATFSNVIDTGVNNGVTLNATASGLTSATSSAFNVTAAVSGTQTMMRRRWR